MGNRRLFVILLGVLAMAMGFCGCQEQQRGGSFIISSFSQPETWLRPYEWTYLRVDLPSWFSSMVMTFMSDVDINKERLAKLSKSRLPVICFKNGSPPLPDVSESYLEDIMSHFPLNGTFGIVQNLGNVEQCIPFQKNLTVVLTNEQISPGVWYLAFFNGLGLARTQSKMISRGQSYMFRTNINVEGCATSTIWGPQCNQTLNTMTCSQASVDLHSRSLLDASSNSSVLMSAENFITCNNSYESSCLGYGELKFYFLDIVGVASQFKISTTDFRLSQMDSTNKKEDLDGILLMCYARYNAMPAKNMSDYSANISGEPLIVNSPRIGRWYIAIQTINQTTSSKLMQEKYAESKMCFSFDWQVNECLNGKVGVNCTWTMHMLQRVPRKNSFFPFGSYYLPPEENDSTKYADFTLENLLSNSSTDNVSWTYLFLEIPHGAAGANMHIELTSDTKLGYDMYIKYGQIADFDTWDYYLNSSGSNNGSMFLVLNDSSGVIDLYILYAREGTWCIGLKHLPDALYRYKTSVSIFLEGCPRDCSPNGECHMSVDRSGMTFYSYCTCDRDHGGFDCSDELVSPQGHIWQSVFLIASNAAAILPAFWALRQKAFSEWVLFTSSGISSGLYHACDVGTWCPLSFHVLQFMDFWLSFMAVVSTFVYMTTISESSKRAIHTSVAILTALLAVSGATRSENIVVVIAIGSLGLLIGWLLEYSTANRSINCLAVFDLLINERWQNIKRWLWNLMKTIQKRFRWYFLFLGFTALALAGTSWKLETDETYWIWHSFWHITIYTSSFFFLCSTYVNSNSERREPEYELTRQNSSRIE